MWLFPAALQSVYPTCVPLYVVSGDLKAVRLDVSSSTQRTTSTPQLWDFPFLSLSLRHKCCFCVLVLYSDKVTLAQTALNPLHTKNSLKCLLHLLPPQNAGVTDLYPMTGLPSFFPLPIVFIRLRNKTPSNSYSETLLKQTRLWSADFAGGSVSVFKVRGWPGLPTPGGPWTPICPLCWLTLSDIP